MDSLKDEKRNNISRREKDMTTKWTKYFTLIILLFCFVVVVLIHDFCDMNINFTIKLYFNYWKSHLSCDYHYKGYYHYKVIPSPTSSVRLSDRPPSPLCGRCTAPLVYYIPTKPLTKLNSNIADLH